jgi:hypothetical protein
MELFELFGRSSAALAGDADHVLSRDGTPLLRLMVRGAPSEVLVLPLE